MERDSSVAETTRRGFLAAGAGLFVFVSASKEAPQEPARLPAPGQEPARLPAPGRGGFGGYPADFNAYLKIGADGRVGGFAGKVELGQGATTALAQCVADELDVSYDSVDMTLGDTDLCPWDMGTFGSMNMPNFSPVLRRAAAEARAVLLDLASEKLGAPVARLRVKDGVVTDSAAPSKRVTYAQLVEGRRIERHVQAFPQKNAAALAVIGKSPRRKDAMDKITGKAKYAGDIILPGMLHARVLQPPARGATLKSVDTSAAEKKPGVTAIKQDGLVAVLHEHRDLADEALGLLKAEFNPAPAGPNDETIFDHLVKHAPAAREAQAVGSLAEGEKAAVSVVEASYLNSYVAHAPMETHSATVKIEDGKCTVWTGTQAPFMVKTAVAQALGAPQENVRIIAGYVGGGFGGKTAAPQAVDAARLAKITGKPVQVVFSRAEEFANDPFRPAAVAKVRAGLDKAGKIAFWSFDMVGAGDRGVDTFYDIPHIRVTSAGGWQGGNPPDMHPFEVGPWRAPSVNSNTFARESHMDSLAAKAGVDPLEFRLKHLSDQRMIRALRAAADRFGWKAAKAPSGRGVGISCGVYSETRAASCAEVAVDKRTGKVQVKRLVLAIDQGLTVDPDGMRQQMEGCITMGLGYALSEEVRFANGAVKNADLGTYEIPRFSWMPQMETILIDNREAPTQAGGEPPIINMGAVLANAIFDATGARVLQLPMTPARVLAAIAKA
jgi:nicotinate dehydrogenase subunit B